MRSLLAAFFLLLTSPHCYGEDDSNYLYAITFSGGFAMTRFAKPDYVETQHKGRPDCIVVNWTYAPSAVDADGALKSTRDSVDAAVGAELTRDPNAIVAAKTLRADTSLWIVCTSAGQGFVAGIQTRLQSLGNSKYKVRLARDPEWSVLSNYLKQLHEK